MGNLYMTSNYVELFCVVFMEISAGGGTALAYLQPYLKGNCP